MSKTATIQAFTAEAALTKYRIAKHGTADGQVVPAAAATDKLVGVTTNIDSDLGEVADVILSGPAEVEYGGTVTRGDPLTSDASGKAVVAAPSAGSNARLIGFAAVSGVAGDVVKIQVALSVMQG